MILVLMETFTKRPTDKVKYDSFKSNLYPVGGYNFMMDLIHFPVDKKNNMQYLLVVIDLWSKAFDIEPMSGRSAEATLRAFLAILKRRYINLENMRSMTSDDGSEFKKEFKKWFKKKSILHSVTLPGRHKQLQPIDGFIGLLSRFFNGVMVANQVKSKKVNNNWTSIVNTVRIQLNKIMIRPDGDPRDLSIYDKFDDSATDDNAKYKVGDEVLRRLDRPEDARGNTQKGKFRTGDFRWAKKIETVEAVYYYPNNIRYRLSGFKNVAYTEEELKLA
mgnify:CR=1 FL=1